MWSRVVGSCRSSPGSRLYTRKLLLRANVRHQCTSLSTDDKQEKGWTWISASASSSRVAEVIDHCCLQLKRQSQGPVPDNSSTIAFVWGGSWHHGNQLHNVPARLEEEGICPAHRVFGATHYHSIMGLGHSPKKLSLCITVAHFPGVQFKPFHMESNEFPKLEFTEQEPSAPVEGDDSDGSEYTDDVILNIEKKRHLMMLVNSYDIELSSVLGRLDLFFPRVPKFGNVWYHSRRETLELAAMFVNGKCVRGGSAGLLIEGDIEIDYLTSRGYVPLGEPFHITDAQDREVTALNGLVAIDAIDGRLEAFGYNPAETNVLYRVMTRPTVPGKTLRENCVHVLRDSAMRMEDPIKVGDKIQFYAYDYHRIINDLGEKLAPHATEKEDKIVLSFSSLMNPDLLQKVAQTHPLGANNGSSSTPVPFYSAVKNLSSEAERITNAIQKRSESNGGGEANSQYKSPPSLPLDLDVIPSTEDMKHEVERLVKYHHKFPEAAGILSHRTLIPHTPASPSDAPSMETTSSVGVVSMAILRPSSSTPSLSAKE